MWIREFNRSQANILVYSFPIYMKNIQLAHELN